MDMLQSLPIDARTGVLFLCGIFFLPHMIAKLRNIDRASLFFEKAGLRPGKPFVVFTVLCEAVAGFGLTTGLYPQVGALVAAAILFVAAWAQNRVHGWSWRWQLQGIEYMLLWGLIVLAAAFLP